MYIDWCMYIILSIHIELYIELYVCNCMYRIIMTAFQHYCHICLPWAKLLQSPMTFQSHLSALSGKKTGRGIQSMGWLKETRKDLQETMGFPNELRGVNHGFPQWMKGGSKPILRFNWLVNIGPLLHCFEWRSNQTKEQIIRAKD